MTTARELIGGGLLLSGVSAGLWLATTKAVLAWAKPCDLSLPERPEVSTDDPGCSRPRTAM